MNADDFEPVEVPDDAPELPPWQEWVVPDGHPHRRFAVSRIPEGAPPAVQEGFARRRIQAVTGECPCGARVQWMDDDGDGARGEIRPVFAPHQMTCPAHDDQLIPAIRAFTQTLDGD
ncbi:hypothetical protein [Microbacterium dextranolyticum]|uniref:Uncharacterized protein n=1 Tax=Microbacterium dextranolyticum TaxID=36806 RepID=A0A9W6HMV7_9MICO|nr:hypothetical protein [Microbacterium dextranolyticum]MBM7463221.1 hypothetical protein [Microbacterium dextranolyticum]GLJ95674.1 hypothetical protein GCM10017591_17370 [Microbacterium dextranolyticum]